MTTSSWGGGQTRNHSHHPLCFFFFHILPSHPAINFNFLIIAHRIGSVGIDSTIEQNLSTLAANPSSHKSTSCITQLWDTFSSLQARHARTSFNKLAQQQRMMMIHHMNWNWLEHFAMDHSIAALSSPVKPIHWAELIARNIHRHLYSIRAIQTTELIIHPPRKLLSTDSDSSPYCYSHKSTSRMPKKDKDKHIPYIAERLVEMLGRWLGYPQDATSRPKAWFIGHLIHNTGPSILLLPSVWQAFNTYKLHVLGDKGIKNIRPKHLVPL